MTDLSDFKRLVYEPETKALRARVAELEAALRWWVSDEPPPGPIEAMVSAHKRLLDGDGGAK